LTPTPGPDILPVQRHIPADKAASDHEPIRA
jgi:hypothetical protein